MKDKWSKVKLKPKINYKFSKYNIKLKDYIYPQFKTLKPDGFWYSVGNSWSKWIRSEGMDWLDDYNYLYSVEVNYNKIIKLNSIKKIKDFTKKYKVKTSNKFISISWDKVAKDYDGIEFSPYFKKSLEFSEDILWYNTIDVASGVVWNTKSITSFDLKYKI